MAPSVGVWMEIIDLKLNDDLSVKTGDLILAEPMLGDPNFRRTVVLICEHGGLQGTLGFVLNKPTLLTIKDLIPEIENDTLVYYGGPVGQNKLFFLHRIKELTESIPITKQVFWGGDLDKLLEMRRKAKVSDKDYRFMLGYSGWASGQLAEELECDSWIIARGMDLNLIFDIAPEQLWEKILHLMGGRYKLFARFPIDPKQN